MTSFDDRRLTMTGRAAFLGFCVIAAVFLITEHTAHVLGALPYLLLLACPLMHIFMHHGHHDHAAHRAPDARRPAVGSDDHA
jgi:hypothetical protein